MSQKHQVEASFSIVIFIGMMVAWAMMSADNCSILANGGTSGINCPNSVTCGTTICSWSYSITGESEQHTQCGWTPTIIPFLAFVSLTLGVGVGVVHALQNNFPSDYKPIVLFGKTLALGLGLLASAVGLIYLGENPCSNPAQVAGVTTTASQIGFYICAGVNVIVAAIIPFLAKSPEAKQINVLPEQQVPLAQ